MHSELKVRLPPQRFAILHRLHDLLHLQQRLSQQLLW
jgi:hypothetical protein